MGFPGNGRCTDGCKWRLPFAGVPAQDHGLDFHSVDRPRSRGSPEAVQINFSCQRPRDFHCIWARAGLAFINHTEVFQLLVVSASERSHRVIALAAVAGDRVVLRIVVPADKKGAADPCRSTAPFNAGLQFRRR